MVKNPRYSIVVIFRVILITLNCFALIWMFTQTTRPATTLFVFILLLFQMGSLIFYHNRINRDLANFLIFLHENDTTLAFSKQRIERSFKGLTFHLDKINQKLQTARLEKERQYQYLQTVVRQIDTGIIAFDQEGRIEILNEAARELLGISPHTKVHVIDELDPELTTTLALKDNKPSSPVKINSKDGNRVLAIKSGSLKFDTRVIRVVSFQNIKSELEAGELDAWRKLIRIQRHEIINSITPITTLTIAIKRLFKNGEIKKKIQDITDEHIDDALGCVDVIEDRSLGLIDFVERFRSLTDVPVLKIESINLEKLTEHLKVLFAREFHDKKIKFNISIVPKNLSIYVDGKLLGQVLINLVKNSIEAIRNPEGEIILRAYRNDQLRIIIQLTDNGIGIDNSLLDSVFVPSFTTKENGSGIGLSISRQIIMKHNGIISVKSIPGIETTFEIELPEQG